MDEFIIHEHMSFDWYVVTYFFLGGIGAGSYFLSVAANFWKESLKPLGFIAAVVSPLSLALGLVILLADLGRPLGFWRLFTTFAPTSVLFWGVWSLNIFFAVSVAYIWLLKKGADDKAKKIAYLGLPFALIVGSYTAVLLWQAPGRILWHSPLLPVIFLLSGLISGIALVMLIAVIAKMSVVSEQLTKIIAYLVAAELGLVMLEISYLYIGSVDAVAMANHLVSGNYSFLFWAIQITAGAVVPMIILFRNKISPSLQVVASVLILVGVFTMRYIVVVGGQVPTY